VEPRPPAKGSWLSSPASVDAVRCAVAVGQPQCPERNTGVRSTSIELRIGIISATLSSGRRLYGDCVNIATRIEGARRTGGVSSPILLHDQCATGCPSSSSLFLAYVKNIARPVRVYRVLHEGPTLTLPRQRGGKRPGARVWRPSPPMAAHCPTSRTIAVLPFAI